MLQQRKGIIIILIFCAILCILPGFKCPAVTESDTDDTTDNPTTFTGTTVLYWVENEKGGGGGEAQKKRLQTLIKEQKKVKGPLTSYVRGIDTKKLSGGFTEIYSGSFVAAYIDVDVKAERIYFSDPAAGTISRINFWGQDLKVIYSGFPGVTGIAIDPPNNTIYFIIYDDVIYKGSMDGSTRESVFYSGVSGEDIAIDLEKRELYFSYFSGPMPREDEPPPFGMYIAKLPLDTPTFPTILSTNLLGNYTYGFFFDSLKKRVYFVTDYYIGYLPSNASDEIPVESIKLSGGEKEVVFAFDVAVDANKIYFTSEGGIYKANLDGSNIEIALSGLTFPIGIGAVIIESANENGGLPINTKTTMKVSEELRGVNITWQHFQDDTRGFHLLRKKVGEKKYERVTKLLIPAKFKRSKYSYIDSYTTRGSEYIYRLEIFKKNGKKISGNSTGIKMKK